MGLDPRVDCLHGRILEVERKLSELETKINDHLDTHEETEDCKVKEI